MYNRILVPVDGSSFSNQMLPLVGAIAKTTGAQVALYRAVEKADKLAEVEQELKALASQHGAEAVVAEVHGDVAEAIHAEAARVPGTLVAITSHGRSGVLRAVLGSTALNVLRSGGDPILVYRPDERHPEANLAVADIQHIVVPLDGSELSESILPQAVQLAKWLKARLVVVSVIDPEVARGAGLPAGDVMESAYVHRQAINLQRDHGVNAGWEVLHGKPDEAIPQFVRSLPHCMLAMTTRGRSAVQSGLLGSVTVAAVRDGGVPIYTRMP